MITDLTEIQNYLKDKHICLLGNSKSILKNKKDIDKYDIVCRINRGIPKGKEKFIGSRTDIVFLSTRFNDSWRAQFNAKFIVWMTRCKKLASNWLKENAIQNPINDWLELKLKFPSNKLPSTGCLTLNFLCKYIKFKKLTIYGFDFFESGTWYHYLKYPPWHEKEIEKQIILDLINKNPNVEIIYE